MASSETTLVLLCGYTETDAGGIYVGAVDSSTGRIQTWRRTPAKGVYFSAIHPRRPTVYTINRAEGGVVTGYTITDEGDSLAVEARQSTAGSGPTYLSVDATGSYAFVANYHGGSITMLPIDDEGRLKQASDTVSHRGSSVHPERQSEAHPHAVLPGPRNRYVYVPDLGADRIDIYRIGFDTDRLIPADESPVEVEPGAGPRHIEFSPTGEHAYVINELNSTISSFRVDQETGDLHKIGTVSTLPGDYRGENYPADVHVHPSGAWVYGSNRGHDSVVRFEVDSQTGRLDSPTHESTRGAWPRDIVIDPSGTRLYAANRNSDAVDAFDIHPETGHVSPRDGRFNLPEPVHMRFAVFGDV